MPEKRDDTPARCCCREIGVAGRISNDQWGGDAQWRDSRQMLLQLPARTLAVQL
ncbi:hypothetical protein MKX03_018677 [Papaver bracteatum]|nr:hypothetical protein MKX03_018677 [Papaver bracteatum]